MLAHEIESAESGAGHVNQSGAFCAENFAVVLTALDLPAASIFAVVQAHHGEFSAPYAAAVQADQAPCLKISQG